MMRQRDLVISALSLLFALHAVCGADTESITSKSDDGIYLSLDDGTRWLVAKSDMSKVRGWSVGDDAVKIDDSESCTIAEIVNTDEHGETACVRDMGSDTVSITDKSDDGGYLGLEDGSKWLVSDADHSTAETWLVNDDVLYIKGSNTCPDVEIIDVDEDGNEVCAHAVT